MVCSPQQTQTPVKGCVIQKHTERVYGIEAGFRVDNCVILSCCIEMVCMSVASRMLGWSVFDVVVLVYVFRFLIYCFL